MARFNALPLLALLLLASPAFAGLRAEFKDTVDETVAAFREAVEDDPLDDDAYYTLVIALELKGEFEAGPARFAELEKRLAKPGEAIIHHRLAAALRNREHEAEAALVDESEDEGVDYVVNRTTEN